MGGSLRLTFHGVRGSTPCHGDEVARYGGNTSCVSLAADGVPPVVFDLGTGLRYFGTSLPPDEPFVGTCLLTHLHWDHVQGLPFFTPLLRPGSHLTVYAPAEHEGGRLDETFSMALAPPFFPVTLEDLPGTLDFHEVDDSEFSIEGYDVRSRIVPHTGRTCGFRVERAGTSITYISDHQQPSDGSFHTSDRVRELCEGVDLLIHDAQYTPAEFAQRRDWGHCMVEYAVWLAAETGVGRLALFHHDPSHDDDQLDRLCAAASACGRARGLEVFGAREGQTVELG